MNSFVMLLFSGLLRLLVGIIIVAGGGNNGGDGFVAARLLHELQAKVRVVLLVPPESIEGDALVNFDRLHDIGVPQTACSLFGSEQQVWTACLFYGVFFLRHH